MSDLLNQLRAHFDAKAVSWRAGSTTQDKSKCRALAYVDARDVMNRLDSVFGPAGWTDSYIETAKGVMLCTLSLRIGGEWISKTDGAGETDVEGEKGKISDAFKRAAVKWGIGRYLYDLPTPWVGYDAQRKQISDDGMRQLQEALTRFAKNSMQAPLPVHATSPSPAEKVDPETGEITSAADFVAQNAPQAEAPKSTTKGGKPSYVPPGGHVLSKAEREARDAARAAQDAQAAQKSSVEVADSMMTTLDGFYDELKSGDINPNEFHIRFNAFEQMRRVAWKSMQREDQARVKEAVTKVQKLWDNARTSGKRGEATGTRAA